MIRKLEMDEVRKGMYVTVLKGKMGMRYHSAERGSPPQILMKELDQYNGKVLEVIYVDMPYIVVTVHEPRGNRNDTLDLRHYKIMKLSKEYVLSIVLT